MILLSGFLQTANAVGVRDDGTSIEGSTSYSCFYLTDVSLGSKGYVVLRFNRKEDRVCINKSEFYSAETVPPNKIRGVNGIDGSQASKIVEILVEPDTKFIVIDTIDYHGRFIRRRHSILKYIEAVKRQNAGWQSAWRESEATLQESKAADKTSPKISITAPSTPSGQKVVRLDNYQAYVRGVVRDNEGVLQVLVNGRKAGLKANGSFASKIKLKLGVNKVSIQAQDINGNIGEKFLTIIREEFIPEDTLADVDMPPKTKMNNPDAVAVVIGVENYQYVADATYAYNDAEVFREYLSETLGYKKSKIKIVTNSKATLAEMNKLLGYNGWLSRNVKPGKSDVVVYFSGHGIPDAKTKKTGLLPFDVDPNYSVGLGLKDLYRTLGSLQARSVTVFLDTCFSGQGREKQTLLADTRGIMIVPKEKAIPENVTVLSAATAGQISGPIKAKEHGLFTYYLLKGLGGTADANKDKKLTMAELTNYVSTKVKEDAAIKGREQTPELQGRANRVLVQW